jgi:hypothetical protein
LSSFAGGFLSLSPHPVVVEINATATIRLHTIPNARFNIRISFSRRRQGHPSDSFDAGPASCSLSLCEERAILSTIFTGADQEQSCIDLRINQHTGGRPFRQPIRDDVERYLVYHDVLVLVAAAGPDAFQTGR